MIKRNIIRQFIFQLIGYAISFVISIITTRLLGSEGRGLLTILLSASSLTTLIIGFGFSSSLTYLIASGKYNLEKVISTVLNFILYIIILSLLTIWLLGVFTPDSIDKFIGQNSLILFSILIVFSFITTFIGSILNAKLEFKLQQNIGLIVSLITLVFYLLLYAYYNHITYSVFVNLYVLLSALPPLSYMLMLRIRKFKTSLEVFDKIIFKAFISFSFTSYASNIFQFLSYKLDFWFVMYYCGNTLLGKYSLAATMAQMIWILPQTISLILYSVSSRTSSDFIEKVNRIVRILNLTLLVVSGSLYLFSDYIIISLYGVEFSESVLYFRYLLIGVVPFSITTVIASVLAGKGLVKLNLYTTIIGVVLTVVLDFLLIPVYGVFGACLASVISYISSTIFIIFVYKQRFGVNISDLLLINNADFKEFIGIFK